MTHVDLMNEIAKLPLSERLQVVEQTVRDIQVEIQGAGEFSSTAQKKQQMAEAAEALLGDYQSENELTAFTALDAEDFHAER